MRVLTPMPVGLAGVRVREVVAGDAHALVLAEAGHAYSFGVGDEGELGLGDTSPRDVPTRVILHGDGPSSYSTSSDGGCRDASPLPATAKGADA